MSKRLINKVLRDAGVKTFDAAAVNLLAEYLESEGGEDVLNKFTGLWKTDGFQGDRLTVESVKSVLAELRGGEPALELFAIINAFQIPKISYDNVGRKLFTDNTPRSIFAPALSKQKLYMDRLNLINQRIRRSTLFQPRGLSGGDAFTPQLKDIQSLKGVVGARRFVIGCISRSEDGKYLLEDSSGTIPLNLTQVQTAAGFYTENCIVIAEGSLQIDGAFHAAALGFPPCEPRENLPMAAQRLNFFGGPALSSEDESRLMVEEVDHDADRMVVLSDVHLDQKEVMDSLHTLFTGYNDLVDALPTLFVLMGNFHSRAGSAGMRVTAAVDMSFATLRDNFDALASLIDQYPRIKAECRFVFIPGPGDPGPGTVLPQPPLPAFFTGALRRVLPSAVFASNPCRIRFLSQQIVFFRYNILKRMRRHCLIPPKDASEWSLMAPPSTQTSTAPTTNTPAGSTQATAKTMWGHLALTLLQQSHLCPLPLLLQPIYWQYDHALHLYPLPHTVVIADASPQVEYSHEGCKVFNPGSFAEGLFVSYKPCSQVVENNEIPRDGVLSYQEDKEVQETRMEEADAEGHDDEGMDVGGRHVHNRDQMQEETEATDRAQPAGCDRESHNAVLVHDLDEVPRDHQLCDVYEGDQEERAAKRQEQPRSKVEERPQSEQEVWDTIVADG